MADKNADENLDINEYIEFAKLRADFNEKRYGEALRYTDQEYQEHFTYYNKLNPEKEGITKEDLKVALFIWLRASLD